MLEKKIVIERIEILEDGQMQIRQATKILEDGVELSKSYHRWVIAPGNDVSSQSDRVKAVAGVIHTKEVIDKYKAKAKKNKW